MSDIPQTFAQWAAYGGINYLERKIINVLIEDRPLLGLMPIVNWPGTEDVRWILNKTAPTITWEAETATHESSQVLRKAITTYLSYGHGDIEVPIHTNSTMNAAFNQEMEDALDLIRAMGISMSSELFTGDYMTEANITILGTGLAATPYVDAVTICSVNMGRGFGGLKYTHTGTFLQFRAPGSSTYGAQVACASDADYTVYDGDDTTKAVTLTLDVTDLGADCELPGALEFQKPERIAGLHGLAQLDSAQIRTVATNGEAVTLAMLDQLDEMVLGPKNEKLYVMNKRTRLVVKSLIAAAGGTRPAEFQDGTIDKKNLAYEQVRIAADTNVAITETQGSASGTCGRVYCVRLNPVVGYHLFGGAHRGPNMGEVKAISDHDAVGGPIQLPVYMRKLGESYTKQQYKWRISAGIAAALKRSKSCGMAYGITS